MLFVLNSNYGMTLTKRMFDIELLLYLCLSFKACNMLCRRHIHALNLSIICEFHIKLRTMVDNVVKDQFNF